MDRDRDRDQKRVCFKESAVERWPLVSPTVYIVYIGLKQKVIGVSMYVNSRQLSIKNVLTFVSWVFFYHPSLSQVHFLYQKHEQDICI